MRLDGSTAASPKVLGKLADVPAIRAAVERELGAKATEHWIWLGAARAETAAAALTAAVALGVGLRAVPLFKRMALRLQALRVCLRRRQLLQRYHQLRAGVAQRADDERSLFLRQREALSQHCGGLGIAQRADEAAERGE